mgnify:CR=1 FL=1
MAGGNTTVPQPIDLLLRLENISADIARLKQRVRYAQTADACPLRSERVAADKSRGVPSREAIRRILYGEPNLLQSVCNVYMQDFLCLGYPLPPGCVVTPKRPSGLHVR